MARNKSLNVESLIHQLRHDPDVFVRIRAAQALASCMDINAALALIEALKAKSSMVGTTGTLTLFGKGDISDTAASSLLQLVPKLRDKRTIGPLLEALQDKDEYVRRVAFVVLCRLSAQLQDDTAVETLVRVQPKIDTEMAGHPIVHSGNEGRKASDELLMLLAELKPKGRPAPFLCALKSTESDVVMFSARTLFETGQAQSVIEVMKHSDIPAPLFDGVFMKLDEIDDKLTMNGLIQLLRDGSPWIRVYAARKLRSYSDNEAIQALSEWQSFFQKMFANKPPKCDICGREPSQQLQNGRYWCSWCGHGFTSEDTYASQSREKE
jgi:HEAT repeat protein